MEQVGFLIISAVIIALVCMIPHTLKSKVDENANLLEEMELKYKNKTLK